MKYQKPEILIEKFDVTDVITASSAGNGGPGIDISDQTVLDMDYVADVLGADTVAEFIFDFFN